MAAINAGMKKSMFLVGVIKVHSDFSLFQDSAVLLFCTNKLDRTFLFLGVHSSDKEKIIFPLLQMRKQSKTSWPGSQAWLNELSWVSVVPDSNRRLLALSMCSALQLFYCCVGIATEKLRCKKQFWIRTLFSYLQSLFRASGVLLGALNSCWHYWKSRWFRFPLAIFRTFQRLHIAKNSENKNSSYSGLVSVATPL